MGKGRPKWDIRRIGGEGRRDTNYDGMAIKRRRRRDCLGLNVPGDGENAFDAVVVRNKSTGELDASPLGRLKKRKS